MPNDMERMRALQAFKEREKTQKNNRNLIIVLGGLALAEILAAVMFFIR